MRRSSVQTPVGFDRLAPFYDVMMQSIFWGNIRKATAYFLYLIQPYDRILLLGGGTGWLASQILQRQPTVQIDFVEYSPKMMQKAQKRLRNASQVHFWQEDAFHFQPSQKYNMIITPFFIDLFEIPKAQYLVAHLSKYVQADGWWLLTDFSANANFAPLKKRFINFMYSVCRLFCPLEASNYWPYETCFSEEVWEETACRSFQGGLIQTSAFRIKPL